LTLATGTPRPEPLVRELSREQTLSSRVLVELERLIVDSHLEAGARLPSERELASQFGVSRTVVREAMRALVAKGLVTIENGRGTVVHAPSALEAAETMSRLLKMQPGGFDYEKVVEVRRVLETNIAELAAARRTPADIASMEAILIEAESKIDDPDAFVEEDIAFHRALASATHNEIFLVILESISQMLIEGRLLALRIPGTPARSIEYHRRILDAVRLGRATAARNAMDSHMDEARETLQQAITEAANP
jgi:GntR family transcriptional repressor for pyruvate dehydrogenase complex